MKKEPVLSIAVILAVISMFVVHPDDTYASYIDFRTLAILFSLMTVMAGLQRQNVFDHIGQVLLYRTKSVKQSEKYFWYCHDSRTSLLLLINGDYK